MNMVNVFEVVKLRVMHSWSTRQPLTAHLNATLNVIFSVMVFYVIMVTFWMTLLMNKSTNIVVDDGWGQPLA